MTEDELEYTEKTGLIELDDEVETLASPDTAVLELDCIKYWIRTFSKSTIPWALFDRTMNLLYQNPAHQATFPDFHSDSNLISFFYRSLGEDEIGRLYRCITDPQWGYSFRGRIVYRNIDRPTVITNLMMSPVFGTDLTREDPPLGWACHFDDVTTETQEMLKNTFRSLLEASKLKDNDTGNHIERVNSYSALLAENLYRRPEFPEVDQDFIADIRFLASMHDVGKIGTPDDILNKNGPLEKWEWAIMKEHTKNGAYLLATYPKPMAREIALSHHEKWNGSGYPYGLSENMIPLSGRIVAVADVYDALRSKRSYKEPMSHAETSALIYKDSGTHFDTRIVEVFSRLEKEFKEIYGNLAD